MIGAPGLAWVEQNLSVCWQSDRHSLSQTVAGWTAYNYRASDATYGLQGEVRLAVTQAYSIERTGISFKGFVTCPTSPEKLAEFPVYLVNRPLVLSNLSKIVYDPSVGVSVVGDVNKIRAPKTVSSLEMNLESPVFPFALPEIFTHEEKWKAAVGFNLDDLATLVRKSFRRTSADIETRLGFNPRLTHPTGDQKMIRDRFSEAAGKYEKDLRKYTIVHEFGHLLGLLHEDRRHDSQNYRPEFCTLRAEDEDRENDGTVGAEESRFETAYDPFSIMSYCRSTMHELYRKIEAVCAVAPFFRNKNRRSLDPIEKFLPKCSLLASHLFPVDLTARDVRGLRLMQKLPVSSAPDSIDFHESSEESELLELLENFSKVGIR